MKYNLADLSTRAPKEFEKEKTKQQLAVILKELDELQNLLFAQSEHSVLIVIQGMDASGKDGAVKNVFGTLNPMGVLVKSFKAPTPEELSHDFLWRIHQHSPAKGYIQIFNRSHYEDILVTRVHKWIDDDMAKKRMNQINHFEQLLTEHGNTIILKFYLHISPEEQMERLQERTADKRKQWKYNANDLKEAALWKEYQAAYNDCFNECNKVPWTIVPSDQNWYKEFVIASAFHQALSNLNMQYPLLKKVE